MRKRKRILALVICAFSFALGVMFTGCKDPESLSQQSQEIKLNYTDCALNVFDALQLEIISGPEGEATWSSEEPTVATVSETGLLEGLASGTTIITVSIADKKATCECTVLPNTSIPRIDMGVLEEVNLLKEDQYTLSPKITYGGTSYTDGVFTYTSVDPNVITVDESGKLTAVDFGKTEIIIKASWRQFTDSEYLVYSLPVTVVYDLMVKIEQTSLTLVPNAMTKYGVEYQDSATLTCVATDNGVVTGDEYLIWRSSNEQVATVNDKGVVTAKGLGMAEITVSYENGEKICESMPLKVTVQNPVIDFTGREPVLIDTWVDTEEFAIGKTTVTCDLSAELFTESYDVTKITDAATGVEIAYNNGDFTNAGLAVGEYVWIVENENYIVKTPVIVATKVIATASELMNIQNFGGVYLTEDVDDTATRKYYNYGGYFVLANDITFTSTDYGDGKSKFTSNYYHMTSVNKETVGFTGVFNGLGYRVYNISVATGGIFGNLAKSSVVKNLNVHNAKLNDQWSGTLAHSVSGTVQNCSISANLGKKSEVATAAYLFYNAKFINVHVTALSGAYGTSSNKGNSTFVCWSRGSACKVENVSVNYTELGTVIGTQNTKLTQYIIIREEGVIEGEDGTGKDLEWDII